MTGRLAIGAAWLAIIVGLTACGGSDDEGGTDGTGSTAAAPDTLFSDDFESVCRGATVAAATPYESGTPGLHPVLVFSGEDPEYSQDFTTLPDGWSAQYPELAATELVACVDRLSATKVETCDGYDVELEGDYSVETYDAIYEVTLYAATTGREIDRVTFDVPATGCPSFVMFTEGENVRPWYEPFGDRLEAFLAPHVAG